MFWKPVKFGDDIKIIYEDIRHPKFTVNFENEEIQENFSRQNVTYSETKDYLLETQKPVVIEPKLGIAILEKGKLLSQTRYHPYMFPDTLQYWKYRRGRTPVKILDEAIHFDGYVSTNYYNFFADAVMTLLWANEKAGLQLDKPIIVGQKTFNTRHFQWLYNNNKHFRNLKWEVLDGKTYIQVNKLYKAYLIVYDTPEWRRLIKYFNPPRVAAPKRKIFLYRKANVGRGVKNMNEIQPLLEKYGFEMIDTSDMTIDDQMALFADVEYFIAIHGAGIMNAIFANHPKFSMIEILPGHEKMNIEFFWMSQLMGYKFYDAILTEDMDMKKRFRLEPDVLEHHIKKMLAN